MISVSDSTGLAQAGATTVRHMIRTHQWTGSTAGLARGFVQAKVAAASAVDYAITPPGQMFMTDMRDTMLSLA
jgi:uncharacterized protein YcsI (UPF0317 family)